MAVQSDISSITYTGNNSTTTSYSVPFVFQENSHLAAIAKVTATGVESVVTLTNHTGAADPNGGTVRTAVAVPATSTLTIFRTVPVTQTTSYAEGGDFPAASHERALDKLTQIAQQTDRKIDRSFRVTEGSGTKNEVVAIPNTLLGLDASNQPKALTVDQVKSLLSITGVTLNVDAGMKTFADAGERALSVPDFAGQLGTQRDTADIYISTGTSAGNWSLVDENMSLADFAAGFFTSDATGRGKFASGFVDAGLLASNSVTTAKISNTSVTAEKLAYDNGPMSGFRNRVINGGMRIDQRNGGASQTFTAGGALAYCVDRFYGYCTGANVTGQQVAGSGGNEFAYSFTGASSVTGIGFATRLEATNTMDLAGSNATLSVQLANSLLTSVTWTVFRANSANTFGTLASPTRTQIATGTFTVNSMLTTYSAVIAIPAAATTGLEIVFTVGAQTSGTWTIDNVQLESGSVATPFEVRPLGVELSLCQRYYYKTFAPSTAPAQNTDPNNAFTFGQLTGASTQGWYSGTSFPVLMRVSPTLTSFNPVANNAEARNASRNADYSATNLSARRYGWLFSATSPAGSAVGDYSYIHVTASAEL